MEISSTNVESYRQTSNTCSAILDQKVAGLAGLKPSKCRGGRFQMVLIRLSRMKLMDVTLLEGVEYKVTGATK
jgi:hypothetical protein